MPDDATRKPHWSDGLKAERDALKTENERLRGEVDVLRADATRSITSSASVPDASSGANASWAEFRPASPFDSEEGRFIEKCLAAAELDFAAGRTTGACKKLFNEVEARVRIWRVIRDVLQRVGPGEDWPQWSTLGRNDSTGKAVEAKPAPAVEPVAPSSPPAVTEGGMPVVPGRPSAADILATVTGGDPRAGLRAEISARPIPGRTLDPAVV